MTDHCFIESPKNPLIQTIRACHSSKGRDLNDFWWIEGSHAVTEAIRCGYSLNNLVIDDTRAHELAPHFQALADEHGVSIQTTSSLGLRALQAAMSTTSPISVGALIQKPISSALKNWPPFKSLSPLILVLDGLQDPGNIGTLLRSAWAFKATGIVLIAPSADISNPKVIRSSAGGIFHTPWRYEENLSHFIQEFKKQFQTSQVLSTAGSSFSGNTTGYRSVNWALPTLLILGNEGHGIQHEADEQSRWVTIPMTDGVDSLNVGVCGSILLAEAFEQKGLSTE